MRRVTGIGGVFFKAKDPKALGQWYKKHLGIDPFWQGFVKGSVIIIAVALVAIMAVRRFSTSSGGTSP